MKAPRRGVAQYEAAVVLVAISLAMTSVLYSAVRKQTIAPEAVFANSLVDLGGSPPLVRLAVNGSEPVTLTSFAADDANSVDGILYLDSGGYHSSQSLCAAGGTTFFSVLATQSGPLRVASNGQSWISGAWTSSQPEAPGWHEVMIVGASTCSLTLPGGQVVAAPGLLTSSVPVEGALNGTSFVLCVPTDPSPHSFLVTTSGGLDAFGH
jgi:hypothetical protein